MNFPSLIYSRSNILSLQLIYYYINQTNVKELEKVNNLFNSVII